jgi:leader peptidase (prepilin peptidase)/N-methyltransferase
MEVLLAGLVGIISAWLVNYLSDILPTQRRLGRPVCVHCQSPQSWADYFTLRTCLNCGKPRAWRNVLTLLVGVTISVGLWLNPPARMGYWLGLLVLTYFGVVVIIDLEHRLILHMVSLFGGILGLVVGVLLHGWSQTLIGGAVGLGVMLLFYIIGIQFARYRARKLGVEDDEEALGFGDVLLSGVLGLLLGWPRILFGLLFGVLVGGIVSFLLIVILVATKRYQSMTVFTAYGPYLVIGAAILLYTPQILTILSEK